MAAFPAFLPFFILSSLSGHKARRLNASTDAPSNGGQSAVTGTLPAGEGIRVCPVSS